MTLLAAFFLTGASPTPEPSPTPPENPPSQTTPRSTVSFSDTIFGFTPGATYGPWRFETLDWRSAQIGRDTPGANLTHRTDHDGANVTHSTQFVADDYHMWTQKFFTYTALGIASGTILPKNSAYLEADTKIGSAWILAAGYGVYNNPDGLVQDYLNVGPSYYFPGGNATVRYIPLWTHGQVGAPSYTANLQLGNEGRFVTTLSWQGGVEPEFAVNDPSVANRFANRTTVFDIDFKKWQSPRFGYHLGFDYASQIARSTGENIYTRHGITAGLFFGIGSTTAPP